MILINDKNIIKLHARRNRYF